MDYELVGACVLISRDTCISLGYELNKFYVSYPILIYSKNGNFDQGVLFFEFETEEETTMRYIPSHLILEQYNISEAKNMYPELFL